MEKHRIDDVAKRIANHRLTRRTALSSLGAASAAVLTRRGRSAFAQDATPASASPAAASNLLIRRNGASLSPAERTAYTDAVLALKKKPSPWAMGISVYDSFVLWHRDAFGCGLNSAHMGPAFFPWHRQFLLLFEQQLRSVDPTVTLVYWDWTVDAAPDSYVWADDFMGGSGDPNQGYVVTTGPFAQKKWTIEIFDYNDTVQNPSLIRDLGGGSLAPNLPTAEDVEQALSVETYDSAPWNSLSPIAQSFRNSLEGWRDCVSETCDPVAGMAPTCTGPHDLHNGVHLWVSGEFEFSHETGAAAINATPVATPPSSEPPTPESSVKILGTMAANSSPSDPVFWLHHTNIDRIWSEWLRRHGPNYLPLSGGPFGHNLNDPMWPYQQLGLTVTPAMMLDARALGYAYDSES